MFGIRLVIGAADKTTGAMRGVEGRLKRFARGIKQALSLGGMTIAFQKLFSMIDKGFGVSTYAKEWDGFKKNMASGWNDIVGRVADAWGPMIAGADKFGQKLLGYMGKFVEEIQGAAAYWGAIFDGQGHEKALEISQQIVESLRKEHEQRKAMQQEQKAESKAQSQAVDRGEDLQAPRRQAAWRSRQSLQSRTEARSGRARLNIGQTGGNYQLNRPLREDHMAGAIDAMDTEQLEETAIGSMSGIRSAVNSAKKRAKQSKKLDRIVRKAEHNVARRTRMGVDRETAIAALPARMRMAMEAKERKTLEESWKKAVLATEEHTRKMAEEMTASTTGGVK